MDQTIQNHGALATDKRLTERVPQPHSIASAVMQIANDSAGRFKHPYDQIDHGTWLYDDQGLPK
jgi:hypothetical protein